MKAEQSDDNLMLKAAKNQRKTSNKKGKGKAVAKDDSAIGVATTKKGPPLVSVAAIVGGLSAQKQRRILDRGVDVLVATPGRLWDLLQEVRVHQNCCVMLLT